MSCRRLPAFGRREQLAALVDLLIDTGRIRQHHIPRPQRPRPQQPERVAPRDGVKHGLPPPNRTGVRMMRISSIRPCSKNDAAKSLPPTRSKPSPGTRFSRAASSESAARREFSPSTRCKRPRKHQLGRAVHLLLDWVVARRGRPVSGHQLVGSAAHDRHVGRLERLHGVGVN